MEDIKKAIDSDNELHIRILRDTLCDLRKENFLMRIAVCFLLAVSVLCAVSVFRQRRGCGCQSASPCYERTSDCVFHGAGARERPKPSGKKSA